MAYIIERLGSRKATVGFESPAQELRFLVAEAVDDLEARLLIESEIPAFLNGMWFQDYDLDDKGGGVFEGTAKYAKRQPEAPPETAGPGEAVPSDFSFEVGSQSIKLTQSLETLESYGDAPPDFKGAIGVNGEKVEGCEIDTPTFTFSETHHFKAAAVTEAYKEKLYLVAAAPVNNATFRFHVAGTVRFLGASGTQKGQQDVAITFKFVASPHVDDLMIGDIGPIVKPGWAYVWTRYADAVDQAQLIKRPVAVYVEKVYKESDFSLLGIGT